MTNTDQFRAIAEESLVFLNKVFKNEEVVNPVSALPYPKEKIEEAILKYIRKIKEDNSNYCNNFYIRICCMALGTFIDDEDAEFVRKIEHDLESATFPLSKKMIKEFFDGGGKESDIARYLAIFFATTNKSREFMDRVDVMLGKF